MNKVFKFYKDTNSGWLGVKVQFLKELGLENAQSDQSKFRGKTVYLQQDVDMLAFKFVYEAKYGPLVYKEVDHGERSWVRNFECVKDSRDLFDLNDKNLGLITEELSKHSER